MKWAKILGAAVGVLVPVIVAAGAALYFGGGRAVRWVLVHPGSTLIGRTIAVGPVGLRWGDPSRLVIDDLRVANAAWDKSNPTMLSARRIDVSIDLRTIVFGPLRVPSVTVEGAKLLLEKSPQTVGNWAFGAGNGAPKKRTEMPLVQRLRIADSELVYRDVKTNKSSDLKIADFALQDPSLAAPITASGNGALQNLPLKIAVRLGAFTALRNASLPYPVRLDGSWGKVDMAIDGTIREPLDFNGLNLRLSLGGSELDEIADAFGVPMPALPPFRGTSVLTGGLGKYQLGAMTVKVGSSDLEGGSISIRRPTCR